MTDDKGKVLFTNNPTKRRQNFNSNIISKEDMKNYKSYTFNPVSKMWEVYGNITVNEDDTFDYFEPPYTIKSLQAKFTTENFKNLLSNDVTEKTLQDDLKKLDNKFK